MDTYVAYLIVETPNHTSTPLVGALPESAFNAYRHELPVDVELEQLVAEQAATYPVGSTLRAFREADGPGFTFRPVLEPIGGDAG